MVPLEPCKQVGASQAGERRQARERQQARVDAWGGVFGAGQQGPGQGAAGRAEAERLADVEGAGPSNLDVVWGHGEPPGDQRQRSGRFK